MVFFFPPEEAILSFVIAYFHVVFHRVGKENDLQFFFFLLEIC